MINTEKNLKLEKKNTKRYNYIDIAKGIGIILVIYGHLILNGPVHNFIYSFHIPLFFFLSGLLFSNIKYNSIDKLVKNRTKTLLLPYIILSIVTYLYWALFETLFTKEEEFLFSFEQIFIAQGSSGYMLHNVPMWFVTCLFSLEVIYLFISKIKKPIIKYTTITTLTIIGCMMTMQNDVFDFTTLFWSIDVAFAALPFYMIGNEINMRVGKENLEKKINKKKIKYIIIAVLLLIILAVTSNINGKVSMGSSNLGNWELFYINSFIGIAGVLILSVLINKNKILEFLGKNSFFIMATHFPLRKPFVILFNKIPVSNAILDYVYAIIITIIVLLIDAILILLIDKIKNKIKKEGTLIQ